MVQRFSRPNDIHALFKKINKTRIATGLGRGTHKEGKAMSECNKEGHEQCSFSVASGHSNLKIVRVGMLDGEDTLMYGTSDPTINPAEVWMTSEVVKKEKIRSWEFFNYPLSEEWIKYDVENIFRPYGFAHKRDPFRAVHEMGIEKNVVDRLIPIRLQKIISSDDPLWNTPLREIVECIKNFRKYKSFVVLNFLSAQKKHGQIYGTDKDKEYKDIYGSLTMGNLLTQTTGKLGGALVYFLFGYHTAQGEKVLLFPHNTRGDVWGAFAAGAFLAGKPARLYPIGGFDLMTHVQWKYWEATKAWCKAPVDVIRILQTHPFYKTLTEELMENKNYCAVSYDEDRNVFEFKLGTP